MLKTLKQTPLAGWHESHGGRMVDFAGWYMPVQYTSIMDEHRAVRSGVGLFDISHMARLLVEGSGAGAWLQSLVPNDVSRLVDGKALYSALCREDGGILDDLVILRLAADRYLVVVNAAPHEKDVRWFEKHLPSSGVTLTEKSIDWAMIAVQGPKALSALSPWLPGLASMAFYTGREADILGAKSIVSRSGYTGEDGFELCVPAGAAPEIWERLIAGGAKPCGLGSRDTLRLEAGLLLYGQDMDETTTPLEVGLGWTVKLEKGEFIGRAGLVKQKAEGTPRTLVAIEMAEPGIPRHGCDVVVDGRKVGVVTSGTRGPTLGRDIGLAFIESAAVQSDLKIVIHGDARRAKITKKPFYRRST